MPSSFTSSLRLTLPATGENSGTWGTLVNTGITDLTDSAIAGTANITIAASDVTLTSVNGLADQARAMILNVTGTPGAARNIICPAVSKLYVVSNNITGGYYVTVKTSAGTGVVIPNGETKLIRCDGTNVLNALTADIVSIVDFGVSLGSTANQTTNIQAAIDAVSAAGGGDLYVPNGTFYVVSLAIKAGVRLVGQSKAAILKMFSTSGVLAMMQANSVSNWGFSNLTVDLSNASGADGNGAVSIYVTSTGATGCNNVTIDSVSFINNTGNGSPLVSRPFISIQPTKISRTYRITNCDFNGRQCIRILPVLTVPAPPTENACGNFYIENNTAKNCVFFVQVRHTPLGFDQMDSFVVSGNQIYSVLDNPDVASSSPYELMCITGLTVTGNTIYTGGRGYNMTFVKNGVLSGNTAYDQTRYFMEMQNSDGITISGNAAYNCQRFVNDTGGTGVNGSTNINIVGNTIVGGNSGEAGYDQFIPQYCIILNSGVPYNNWRITDNLFSGLTYKVGTIRIDGTVGSTKNFVIENNTFIQSDPQEQILTILIRASDVIVRNNNIRRTANITDATYGTNRDGTFNPATPTVVTGIVVNPAQAVITDATSGLGVGNLVIGTNIPAGTTIVSIDSSTQITLSAAFTGGSITTQSFTVVDVSIPTFISIPVTAAQDNITVDNNYIQWSGVDARSSIANTGLIGVGGATGATANITKATFTNNKLTGNYSGTTGTGYATFRLSYNTGDTVFLNNDISQVTAGAESLNAAIVYRRTKRTFESTASPTAGTYIVGDRAWNSVPTVGQPKSWVCTVAGTPGTWVSEGNL